MMPTIVPILGACTVGLVLFAGIVAVSQWQSRHQYRLPRFIVRVWDSLQPNRVRKLLASIAYAAAFMCGLSTLLWPPRSIEGVLGVLTPMFGLFYLLGGAAALAVVFRGWWWLERMAIGAILVGVAIYIIVVLSLHWQSAMGSRLSQYWAIAVSVPLLVYRLADIYPHPYEPRPETARRDG